MVQFVIGDVAIRVVNICEKVKIGDAGETDKIIAEFIHGDPWYGGDELFFKFALAEEYVLSLDIDAVNFRLVSVIWGPVVVMRWRVEELG